MYFDAISDILDNTKLSNKMENKLFRYFYTWMKSLCEKADNKSEKLQSSAIKLLYNHMDCFRKPLYDDYQEWHRNLLRLSREKSTLIHGQKALKTFYKVIGKILEEQDEERSQTVLRVSKIDMKLSIATMICLLKTCHDRDKKLKFLSFCFD